MEYRCEYCDQPCNEEFGDVRNAIVCPKCLGWYDYPGDPEVLRIVAQMEMELK